MGLRQNHRSNMFAQMIASAKAWGLVDGVTEIRLSDLGREYFYPTTASGTRQAELRLLTQPTAYAYIIKTFDGAELPKTPIIGNLLAKNAGVPISWKGRAAQIFVNAADELGVLDGGVLRYQAALHMAGKPNDSPTDEPQEPPTGWTIGAAEFKGTGHSFAPPIAARTSPAATLQASSSNAWVFSEGGSTVRLETPNPIPRTLWERLTRYVELLEPAEDTNKEV